VRRRAHAEAGLTLVELLVTIVVASLVASSTFVFFAGQQRIYDTQTKLLNVQQNLWAALETLARHVRAAGTGMVGCVPPGAPTPTGASAPATGLRAYRSGTGLVRIAPVWIRNGAAGAPDEITVAFGTGMSGHYSDSSLLVTMPAETPTAVLQAPLGFAKSFVQDEFIVLLDTTPLASMAAGRNGDRGCSLFQITGFGLADIINHTSTSSWNPAGNTAGLVPWAYGGAPGGSGGIRNLGQLNWVRFYIDSAGAPTTPPRLMMDDLTDALAAQVLADGMEDLQIAYACDLAPAGNPDGALTEGTDAATRNADEWTYNQSADVPPAACTQPVAIRISLIGRSLTADTTLLASGGAVGDTSQTLSFKPTAEDGAAGAADTFRHRVLTTTVYPRNN
jgi:prepilin-type N-terminal cleavage/methylation domain-containing protein